MAKLNVQTVKTYRDTNGILHTRQQDALHAQNEIDLREALVKTGEIPDSVIDDCIRIFRDYPDIVTEWVNTMGDIHNGVYSEEEDQ